MVQTGTTKPWVNDLLSYLELRVVKLLSFYVSGALGETNLASIVASEVFWLGWLEFWSKKHVFWLEQEACVLIGDN